MTCDSGTAKTLVENLLNDLRLLSSEAKKYGQVRESCETAIMKLRGVSAILSADKLSNHRIFSSISIDLIQPFSLALKSKQPKFVQIALTSLQRLISHEIFDVNLARYLVDDLWILMENEIEELRILQTMALLGNYSLYVTGEVLAKSLVICFRLNFAKDPLVINTASATVRQLVAQVYERCSQQNGVAKSHGITAQKVLGRSAPSTLSSTEADAFMLFQDLCRLVNAEPPYWLLGITEMTRTLGLDLLDSILTQNPDVFAKKPEFIFILKELVCPLVVKLFSPNLKYGQKQLHGQLMAGSNSTENVSSRAMDKPYFPIVLRLNRLVLTLILRYHQVLSTECEIFLSLLLKFLDQDKIDWYRALAIETVYKIVKKKELLKYFCDTYDSKPYSTKVVRDLISCIQNFLRLSFTCFSMENTNNAVDPTDNAADQAAFIIGHICLPYLDVFNQPCSKILFSEMLEKVEPPEPPEGYFLSAAFRCVIEIANSIVCLAEEDIKTSIENGHVFKANEQMLLSSSGPLLSCFATLLENCFDDNLVDELLQSMTAVLNLISMLPSLQASKRAYISYYCAASLPVNYYTTVLLNDSGKSSNQKVDDFDETRNLKAKNIAHKVYAVTTPCPTPGMSLNLLNTRVTVTLKNLIVARYFLKTMIGDEKLFDDVWPEIFVTLQHLCWVLNLKPSPSTGLLEPPSSDTTASNRSPTMMRASINTLPAMNYVAQIAFNISSLIKKTNELPAESVHLIIDALLKLSDDCQKVHQEGRDPSYFSICKFVELITANLNRSDAFIQKVINQLFKLSSKPYQLLREVSISALISITSTIIVERGSSGLFTSTSLLEILRKINCENPYPEVIHQQINCVLQILHCRSQTLNDCLWPILIESVSNLSGMNAKESIIRQAFQAVQLIASDTLSCLSQESSKTLLNTILRFGCQTTDTNISLSAIGLLWNINDYLFTVPESDDKIDLWMDLYNNLSQLCVEDRPAVRKSACETLFGTLHGHSNDLSVNLSFLILSRVLLSLLRKIERKCFEANSQALRAKKTSEFSPEKDENSILVHHSRDTKEKQWAETSVSAVCGVCRFFAVKYPSISSSLDYKTRLDLWSNLLNTIRDLASSTNEEIAVESLKCFNDLMSNSVLVSPTIIHNHSKHETNEDSVIKCHAWTIWLDIAQTSQDQFIRRSPDSQFLRLLLRLFMLLFDLAKDLVEPKTISKSYCVFKHIAEIPFVQLQTPLNRRPPLLIAFNSDEMLTCHKLLLDCVKIKCQELSLPSSPMNILSAEFAMFCTSLANSCWEYTKCMDYDAKKTSTNNLKNMYDRLAQLILRISVEFYKKIAENESVLENKVAYYFLQALHKPLSTEYSSELTNNYYYKQSVQSLTDLIEFIIPDSNAVFIKRPDRIEFFNKLADCIEAFMSLSCKETVKNLSFEEESCRRFLDSKLMETVNNKILPNVKYLPSNFVDRVVNLFRQVSANRCEEKTTNFTEPFVKPSDDELQLNLPLLCLNALSDISKQNVDLLDQNGDSGSDKDAKLSVIGAAEVCLSTCHEIISSFVQDMKKTADIPLPRHRSEEIEKVLRLINNLIESLKSSCTDHRKEKRNLHNSQDYFLTQSLSNPADDECQTRRQYNRRILNKLYALYPLLVDIVPCNNRRIREELVRTLKSFALFFG